jgi:hypothetical protein
MQLIAEPASGLIDEPVTWRVTDVPRGTVVTLTVSGVDGEGHRWLSTGRSTVGADQTLDIADPQTVFTRMQFDDDPQVPVRFAASLEPWVCRATVESDGKSAQTTMQRLHHRNSESAQITGDEFRLTTFAPGGGPDAGSGIGPNPGSDPGEATAVLLVPGTTGPAAMVPRAALLAAHGHPTAVLTYMQEPGLPPSLREIPVEVLQRGIAAFAQAVPAAGTRLVVWAASVGVQLALAGLIGVDVPGLRGVVSVAPTSVVWQALSAGGRPAKTSSLTRQGTALPWLPVRGELLLGQIIGNAIRRRLPGRPRSDALRLLPAYRVGLEKAKPAQLDPAALPVEQIESPLLLIAGEADEMWPAATMAQAIMTRRREHGRTGDRLVSLPGTGHFIGPPSLPMTVDRSANLVSGGTPAGIADRDVVAWNAALAFLADV